MSAFNEKEHLDHPLVQWVKAVYSDGRAIKHSDLFDGVLLNDLMSIVDPRPSDDIVCRDGQDFSSRLFNWDILLKSIQAYYKDILQFYLCADLPDIYLIASEPLTEDGFKEVCKFLLLILGCAVQGEKREDFISNIKQLEVTSQHAIVTYIQQITDESQSILPMERNCSDEEYIEKLTTHVDRLLKERNSFSHSLMELKHESKKQEIHEKMNAALLLEQPIVSESDPNEKVKNRVLQLQIDEKDETISDLRDEIEDIRRNMLALKTENLDLVQRVHSIRNLQDDLDAYKERASKAAGLEEEVAKLKKKLNDVDFYKARIQELQEDNKVLEETKSFLEEQVGSSHVRLETVTKLENDLKKNKLLLDEYCQKIDKDGEKISLLTQENMELQRELNLLTENKITQDVNLSLDRIENPISAELQGSANVSKLHLELENQRLNQQLLEINEELQSLKQKRLDMESDAESHENKALKLKEEALQMEQENRELKKQLQEKEKNSELLEKKLSLVVQEVSNMATEKKKNEQIESDYKILFEKYTKSETELKNKMQIIEEMTETSEKSKLEVERLKNHLETEKSSNQIRCDELQSDIDKLTKQLLNSKEEKDADASSRILELESLNEKLKEQISLMDSEMEQQLDAEEEVKLENEQLQGKIKNLEEQLQTEEENKNKSEQLESENKNLNERLNQVQRELEKKIEESKEEREILINLKSENADLRHEVDVVTTAKADEVEIQNKRLIEKLTLTEDELESVKERLAESSALNESLTREKTEFTENQAEVVDRLESRNQILLEKLSQTQENLESEKKTRTKLEQKLSKAELDDEETKSLNESYSDKVKQLNTENEELNQQLTDMEEELNFLREKQKKSDALQESQEEELNDLDTENQKLIEKVRLTNEECEMLRQNLSQMEEDRRIFEENSLNISDSQEENLKKVLSENKKLEDAVNSLNSELDQSRKQSEAEWKLKESLNESDSVIQELRQQLLESEEETERLQNEVKTYKAQLDNLLEENGDLRGDRESAIHHLERTNQTLVQKLEMKQEECDSVKSKLKHIEDENRHLEDKINYNQKQAESLTKLQMENNELVSQLHSAESEVKVLVQKIADHEAEKRFQVDTSAVDNIRKESVTLTQSSTRPTPQVNGMVVSPSFIKRQISLTSRLQIQNSAIQCQFASLISQNSTLQNQLALLESEHENLLFNHEEMQVAHGRVLCDYEKLQEIHELITLEFEDLVSEYILVRKKLMNPVIDRNRSDMMADNDGMSSSSSNTELKRYTGNKSEWSEYQDDIYDSLDDPFEDFSAIDHDVQQMENTVNTLIMINAKLEEENQALIQQLQQLLNQNQELLTSAINSKDHFNEEEKTYIEKLAELRRNKERLEEKIIAHYSSRMDTPKKSRGLNAIMKRLRAALMKDHKNKSRNSLDNQNQGMSVSHLNLAKRDQDTKYHSNFETGEDPEKLTLVEFLTEERDSSLATNNSR